MHSIWEPALSPTGDRIVGKRQIGASAFIVGDPHRRIWQQHDESLEAFTATSLIEDELKRLKRPDDYPVTGLVWGLAAQHKDRWDILPK
jgi:hypothetical protein